MPVAREPGYQLLSLHVRSSSLCMSLHVMHVSFHRQPTDQIHNFVLHVSDQCVASVTLVRCISYTCALHQIHQCDQIHQCVRDKLVCAMCATEVVNVHVRDWACECSEERWSSACSWQHCVTRHVGAARTHTRTRTRTCGVAYYDTLVRYALVRCMC